MSSPMLASEEKLGAAENDLSFTNQQVSSYDVLSNRRGSSCSP